MDLRSMSRRPLAASSQYAVALAGVAVATWLRLLLDPLLGDHLPFVTFFVAVMVASWFGGVGSSIAALLLGCAAATYFFVPPRHSFAISGMANAVGLFLYFFVGISSVILIQARHAAQRQIEASEEKLRRLNADLELRVQERTAELFKTNAALSAEITERKRVEEALRQSEDWFRSLIENAPDLITVLDSDGTIRYESPSVYRLLEYAPADLLGKSAFSFIRPDDLPRVSAALTQVLQAPGTRQSVEVRFRKNDGQWLTLEATGQSVRDASGRMTVVVNSRDITERKRAEEALKASEERFEAFMSHSPAVAFLKDEQGRYVYVNAGVTNSFSLREADWKSKTDDDLWPADVARKLIEHDRAVLVENKVMEVIETVPTSDGRSLHWLVLKFPVKDASGRLFIGGMGIDITERKRAEAELYQSREMLRLIVDTIPQYVFWKDRNSNYLGCNTLFAHAAGVEEPAAIVGKNDFELFWKENAELYRADDRLVMETKTPKLNFEEPLTRADGNPWAIRTSKVPLYDQTGQVFGVLGIFEDITDRKRMEAQARQLERLSALNQLLGGIAHELKNPLFILTGFLQLVGEKLAQHQYDELPRDFQKIQETAKRLTAVAERFLQLAGQVSARMERCSVPAVLQKTLDSLGQELTRNRVRVVTAYAQGLPDIQADPAQLREVFEHLIVNAVQAMAEAHGKGTLTVSAALVTDAETRRRGDAAIAPSPLRPVTPSDAEGGWIEVRIQDDGPGIAPEHRTKVFEPFFTTKQPDKGTGLGLWIVRSNLMMLRGTVQMETNVGQGTTFTVQLPTVTEPLASSKQQGT